MSETERAVADLGAIELSVRVDGEWCPEMAWYKPDLPVFTADDGSEIDIRDDGSILYETPDGAVQEVDCERDDGTTRVFEPLSIYPADTIEVVEIER